jgi:hypothetical protein
MSKKEKKKTKKKNGMVLTSGKRLRRGNLDQRIRLYLYPLGAPDEPGVATNLRHVAEVDYVRRRREDSTDVQSLFSLQDTSSRSKTSCF